MLRIMQHTKVRAHYARPHANFCSGDSRPPTSVDLKIAQSSLSSVAGHKKQLCFEKYSPLMQSHLCAAQRLSLLTVYPLFVLHVGPFSVYGPLWLR